MLKIKHSKTFDKFNNSIPPTFQNQTIHKYGIQ